MKTDILNGIEGKRKEKMRQIMEESQLLKVQKEVLYKTYNTNLLLVE